MSDEGFTGGYLEYVRALLGAHPEDVAMSLAVGGEADAFGRVELDYLVQIGLEPDHYLVDVGCGSGRLTRAARTYLRGRYLGLDVVPELLDYARRLAPPDWRIELATGPTIPERDQAVDMVVFFSVLTHLSPRDSFRYLRDARRVLRAGGLAVFSFLELGLPAHWQIFETFVREADEPATAPKSVRMDFLDRETIGIWAERLGFETVALVRGDQPIVRLREPITLSNGQAVPSPAAFGQSLCVLRAAAR